ncbi:MAG: TlpA disulfide reductase family protein [Candidatus Omnitrophota bacterium]
MRIKGWVLGVAIACLMFIAGGLLSCQGGAASIGVGSMAPDFTLEDLAGKSFSLSDVKGKVVILSFWSTTCSACKLEMPHFQTLHEEYADKDLVIIGVALDRFGIFVVKPFVDARGITFPILLADNEIEAAYGGIEWLPTTFVIDREGRIVEKREGAESKAFFESVIEKLL